MLGLVDEIVRERPDASREDIRRAVLARLSDATFPGPAGRWSFDREGFPLGQRFTLWTLDTGEARHGAEIPLT